MSYSTDKRKEIGIDSFLCNRDSNTKQREYKKGSVVYFITKKNNEYFIDYGLAVDNYQDYVTLEILEPRDRRLIDGIPYKEYPAYSDWRKLPASFDWNNQLGSVCEMTMEDMTDDDKAVDITSPESILTAFNNGALVKSRTVDHSRLHIMIDSRYGYRLFKSYVCVTDDDEHFPAIARATNTAIDYCRCFPTYEAAQHRIEDYLNEIKKQMAMSEHDWNVEMVTEDVEWWCSGNKKSEEDKRKALDFLLNLEDFDEYETRAVGPTLEYRKLGNKKWIDYSPETTIEFLKDMSKADPDWDNIYKHSEQMPFDSWVPEPQYAKRKGESWSW